MDSLINCCCLRSGSGRPYLVTFCHARALRESRLLLINKRFDDVVASREQSGWMARAPDMERLVAQFVALGGRPSLAVVAQFVALGGRPSLAVGVTTVEHG